MLAIIGAAVILGGFITVASAESDKMFLADAIQINLAEISIGELAQKNGGSDKVKRPYCLKHQSHFACSGKRRDGPHRAESRGYKEIR
jgi:hypothetical protein